MISRAYGAIVDPARQPMNLSGVALSYVSLVKDAMRDHILAAAPIAAQFCNLDDVSTLDDFISWSFKSRASLDWRTGISLLSYISKDQCPSQPLVSQLMSYAVSQWTFTDRTSDVCIAAWTNLSPGRIFVATKATVAYEERDVFYYDLQAHSSLVTEMSYLAFPQMAQLERHFGI